MSNKKLDRALRRSNKKKEDKVVMLSGQLGIPLNGQKLVEVPNRQGFVFVRLKNNTSELIQAYNNAVSPIYDLPVLVARQTNGYRVMGRNIDRYTNQWGQAPYLPKHGAQHSFNPDLNIGGDIVWVYSQQFMPLLGYPSGSAGSPRLAISPYIIQDLSGNWKYVGNTGTPDVTPYSPTTGSRSVIGLLYIDTVSGNPGFLINSGTYIDSSLTGSNSIVPYIPRPSASQLPISAIRLVSGTSILTWDNVYDVRPFLQVLPTGSSGSGAMSFQDEGVPLGTATTLNVVGVNADISISGSVAKLFITGSTGGAVNPPITGSFVVQSLGQTLGSATTLNVGSGLSVSISGTIANIQGTASGGNLRVVQPSPLGSVSGTYWKVPDNVYITGSLGVFLNGHALIPSVDYIEQYSSSGTYQYLSAPPTGTYHLVHYSTGGGGSGGSTSTGTSSANHAYYQYLAASLEPDAIEPIQGGTFSYAVASNVTKMLIASWGTRLGSAGRMEIRNQRDFLFLRGVTLAGLSSSSCALIIDPALPTYADARQTYYDRLLAIATSTPKYLGIGADTTIPFLPGAYGAIVLQTTNYNSAWNSIRTNGDLYGWALVDEINDASAFRIAASMRFAVNKLVACEFKSSAGADTGETRGSSLVYVLCPSTWSVITDPTTYLFRDDFMAATLDTTTNWNTPTQSTAGNVSINTDYQWLKSVGNASWGNNGVHSKYNIARTSGKKFVCDVFTSLHTNSHVNNGLIVGWHDGTGDSYTDFAHGIMFTSSGAAPVLHVFENGNDRGTVGSGYTLGTIYRVRITLDSAGANSAKYEIQGGAYGALGSASWTDITPGTTSSSTTPVYVGVASALTNPFYVSDVKVF